jgi:putative transposase
VAHAEGVNVDSRVQRPRKLALDLHAEGVNVNSRGQRPRKSHKTRSALKGPHLTKGKSMSQTLTSLLVHLVFSTKHRQQIITPKIEPHLFAYIGGILRNNQSRLLDAGGTSDHVHLLVSQSKNLALSALLKDIKGDSSSWMKTQGREFRNFYWQEGYGAFSFSKNDLRRLKLYVASQKIHHAKWTFKEEFIVLLDENGVEYDERYLWG